jgi:hypothetical protein
MLADIEKRVYSTTLYTSPRSLQRVLHFPTITVSVHVGARYHHTSPVWIVFSNITSLTMQYYNIKAGRQYGRRLS